MTQLTTEQMKQLHDDHVAADNAKRLAKYMDLYTDDCYMSFARRLALSAATWSSCNCFICSVVSWVIAAPPDLRRDAALSSTRRRWPARRALVMRACRGDEPRTT